VGAEQSIQWSQRRSEAQCEGQCRLFPVRRFESALWKGRMLTRRPSLQRQDVWHDPKWSMFFVLELVLFVGIASVCWIFDHEVHAQC
jgi:hypothetical protein